MFSSPVQESCSVFLSLTSRVDLQEWVGIRTSLSSLEILLRSPPIQLNSKLTWSGQQATSIMNSCAQELLLSLRPFSVVELTSPFDSDNQWHALVARSNGWVERVSSRTREATRFPGRPSMITSSHWSLLTRARKPIRVQRSFFFERNRWKSFFKSTDGWSSLVCRAQGNKPYLAVRSSSTASWANHLKNPRVSPIRRLSNLQGQIKGIFRIVMFA